MEGEQPFVERDVRILKDRADRYRELLPATVALIQALPCVRLAAFLRLELSGLAYDAAMRANRSIRPHELFQVLACRVIVLKLLLEESRRALIMRF
jgi:hypothetical protein